MAEIPLCDRCRPMEAWLAECRSILGWVEMAARGEAVPDFATSYPVINQIRELREGAVSPPALEAIQHALDTPFGLFLHVKVTSRDLTFDGQELVGEGISRKNAKAYAYALEDLAAKLRKM